MSVLVLCVLLDLLQERGVITTEEKSDINSFSALLTLLESLNRVQPVSDQEREIIKRLQNISAKDSKSLLQELKGILSSTTEKNTRKLLGSIVSILDKLLQGL